MISEVHTESGASAITSDQWHIIHARYTFDGAKRPYLRSVHSEHADRTACRRVARALREQLLAQENGVAMDQRDEVFVRKPGFKTLKVSRSGQHKAGDSA